MEATPVITQRASSSRDLTLPGPAWAMIYWPDRPNGTQGREGRKAVNRVNYPDNAQGDGEDNGHVGVGAGAGLGRGELRLGQPGDLRGHRHLSGAGTQ